MATEQEVDICQLPKSYAINNLHEEWGNALRHTWGIGVDQSINTAAQPLVIHVHIMTDLWLGIPKD